MPLYPYPDEGVVITGQNHMHSFHVTQLPCWDPFTSASSHPRSALCSPLLVLQQQSAVLTKDLRQQHNIAVSQQILINMLYLYEGKQDYCQPRARAQMSRFYVICLIGFQYSTVNTQCDQQSLHLRSEISSHLPWNFLYKSPE